MGPLRADCGHSGCCRFQHEREILRCGFGLKINHKYGYPLNGALIVEFVPAFVQEVSSIGV